MQIYLAKLGKTEYVHDIYYLFYVTGGKRAYISPDVSDYRRGHRITEVSNARCRPLGDW